jgi:hypothetical protein
MLQRWGNRARMTAKSRFPYNTARRYRTEPIFTIFSFDASLLPWDAQPPRTRRM